MLLCLDQINFHQTKVFLQLLELSFQIVSIKFSRCPIHFSNNELSFVVFIDFSEFNNLALKFKNSLFKLFFIQTNDRGKLLHRLNWFWVKHIPY